MKSQASSSKTAVICGLPEGNTVKILLVDHISLRMDINNDDSKLVTYTWITTLNISQTFAEF